MSRMCSYPVKYTIFDGTAISSVSDIPLHKVVAPSTFAIFRNASNVPVNLSEELTQFSSWKHAFSQKILAAWLTAVRGAWRVDPFTPDKSVVFSAFGPAIVSVRPGISHLQSGSILCCCKRTLTTSMGVNVREVRSEPTTALSMRSLNESLAESLVVIIA